MVLKKKRKTDFDPDQSPHRGVLTLVWGGSELTQSWSQDTPITIGEGLRLVDQLSEHAKGVTGERAKGLFETLKAFILKAGERKGANAAVCKTYLLDGPSHRLTIEINAGRAFVA